MYIRRKPNKSGSVSVQLISKEGGRYIVVKSFGAGKTEEEIFLLEHQAHAYMRSLRGEELPLWDNPTGEIIHQFMNTLSNRDFHLIGPELIYGKLYDRIGYGEIKQELFRHLVISRLASPGSKLETIDYLSRHLNVSYRIDQIYRFLDNLCVRDKRKKQKSLKEVVEQITFRYTKQVVGGAIGVVFYDMTTLYFEASKEDDLRRIGYSKDGKHSHPQIFLGLLVAVEGNPIGYEIFEGNIFEGHTLIPVLEEMQKKFGLGKPVVVADAGLLSKRNIRVLEANGYQYILGARIKNETDAVKKAILELGLTDGSVHSIEKEGNTRLIVSKTAARVQKDEKNRERGLKRLRAQIRMGRLTKSHINNRGYNRFLKMTGQVEIEVDEEKISADRKWDGLKGYITNTGLSNQVILENYKHLWFIERAFRMSKTDLRIRPVYHRLRNRIEGHICICFTAYTILLELERILKRSQSGLSLKDAERLTMSMNQIRYHVPGENRTYTQILKMDEQQQELLNLVQNT